MNVAMVAVKQTMKIEYSKQRPDLPAEELVRLLDSKKRDQHSVKEAVFLF